MCYAHALLAAPCPANRHPWRPAHPSPSSSPIPTPAPPQVLGFWGKAQRVVLYKVRSEVEAKKKEVMDKQVGLVD